MKLIRKLLWIAFLLLLALVLIVVMAFASFGTIFTVKTDLDADTLKAASDSWKRTMDIVGPGLQDCQNWLAQAREQKLNPTPEETN